jgi:hypothetical protein
MKKIFVVLAAVLLLAIMACSGGGDDGGTSNNSDPNATVLASNAKQLDSSTTGNLSSVSADGANLSFSATTTQLDALKQDDVIISDVTTAAPRGLLKKVVSVTTLPDGTVQVTTTPAALTDAFQELHVSGTITGVSNESLVNKSIKIIKKALGTSDTVNIPDISCQIPLTDVSGSSSYSASLSGNYKFTPDLTYNIDISGSKLNTFKVAFTGSQTLNLDGVFSATQAISYSPEKELKKLSKTLATITVWVTVGPVPVPIIFTIDFTPYLGIEISAENKVDINAGFTSSSSMTAGFEYTNGTPSPIASYSGSFTPYYTISDQVSLSLMPYLRVELGFFLYDALGPYIDVKPYGKIAAVSTPNFHLEKSVGIKGDAGGKLEVFDWTLANFSIELFDINIPLSESAYSITGRITDASGTPLSGVTVALSGDSSASATTDGAGYYKFTNLPNGSYTVTPSLSGYSFNPLSLPVVVDSGDAIVPRVIDTTTSTATYSMSGTIHVGSDSGAVLSGATVSIAGLTATTGSAGTFTITGIPAGTYAFSVAKSGYDTYTNSAYYIGSDQTGLNFYLTQPTSAH